MTLVLPRTIYEYRSLLLHTEGKPICVCLDDYPQLGQFLAFACEANEQWTGLHIPGVRIELDETSLYDSQGYVLPLGAMVRFDDRLLLQARFEGHILGMSNGVVIYSGLPPCAPQQSACFLKWQIVLGEGDAKRVLATVDATPKTR